MTDMMVVAFKADITRISTIMMGREGSTRAYPEIGVADGHHPLTHHMGNMQMLEKVRQINSSTLKLFAEFLTKLKNTKEGDSNLLDQSLIVYGSGLSDGNVHTHDQLPTLLCGRGGNFVTPGRHIIYQRETPVANLFATMIERVGVRPEHVGDSTGTAGRPVAELRVGHAAESIWRKPPHRGSLQHVDEPSRRGVGAGRACTASKVSAKRTMGSVCVVGAGLKAAIFCDMVGARLSCPARTRNGNQTLAVGLAASILCRPIPRW